MLRLKKKETMKNVMTDPLKEFNQLYKKMDEIYHSYAKQLNISDMVLWLLYSLYESSRAYTQRELCSDWHYPPQTINSALKSLEKQGIIVLRHSAGNLKNKQIVLTEQGAAYVQRVIYPLVAAERRTFQSMKEEEREALLSNTCQYIELLQAEIEKIRRSDEALPSGKGTTKQI